MSPKELKKKKKVMEMRRNRLRFHKLYLIVNGKKNDNEMAVDRERKKKRIMISKKKKKWSIYMLFENSKTFIRFIFFFLGGI